MMLSHRQGDGELVGETLFQQLNQGQGYLALTDFGGHGQWFSRCIHSGFLRF